MALDIDGMRRRWEAEALRRLNAAAIAWQNAARELLSVAAPRGRSKKTGKVYAKTRAIPGAPPRKVTGQLRRSVACRIDRQTMSARCGCSAFYGAILERKDHEWAIVALNQERQAINAILAGA